jgi:sensor histidine kinase regulating citrate/malate metabolism
LLRQQSHDHINHIQTVSAMLMLDEVKTAKDYLKGISKNYHFTGHFLRLGNPSLTALVNIKLELAAQKNIHCEVLKYCRVKLKNIAPWDLTALIGNLFENAMEHVLSQETLERALKFSIENTENLKGYKIVLSNPYLEKSFDLEKYKGLGFSTKAKEGRGYGLNIIYEISKKYKGNFYTELKDHWLHMVVVLEEK